MKSVSFDPHVKIQHMHVWVFAYREARKNDLAKLAADKFRFDLRKQKFEAMLDKIGFFSKS